MKDFSTEIEVLDELLSKVRNQVEEMKMGMGSEESKPEDMMAHESAESKDKEMMESMSESPEDEMDEESKGLKSYMEGEDKPKQAPKMGLMIGISAGKKPPMKPGFPFKKK